LIKLGAGMNTRSGSGWLLESVSAEYFIAPCCCWTSVGRSN